MPNLVKINQIAAYIWRFFKMAVQDGGRRDLGFFKFEIFNGRSAEVGGTASLCQILSKLAKTWPRYSDFSIFQDGGRCHLGFFNFQIFNDRTAEEGRTVSPCQISQNAPEIWRFSDFWATVCKTVRPMLSVRCLSCLSVCL